MRYSELTHRIAGEGSAAWDLHFEAIRAQAAGEPVIVLSVGDPDFDTPASLVQSAIDSLHAGHTHYPEILGLPRLRQLIAQRFEQRTGHPMSASNVAVSAGGQCALYTAAMCTLNVGDEVLVVDPTYVTYEGVFGAVGAHMKRVPARAENGFLPQVEDIRAALGPRTRALVINSPNNPTGSVLGLADWEGIARLCQAHDLWLLSDEVYGDLVYEGTHISPASLPDMAERTITINSLSKSHAMTGWRLGWLMGPPALIDHVGNLYLAMLYGCPSFVQQAACTALSSDLPEVPRMRDEYRARRDAVVQAVSDAPGVKAIVPQAGMFVMLDIKATGLGAQEFARRLYDEQRVSVLCGDAFGQQTLGCVRVGLVEPVEVLAEACRRIALLAHELSPTGAILP